MKVKPQNPFTQTSTTSKQKQKTKRKFLECGDIYLLRPDSKKKALTVLQSKLQSERKNIPRVPLKVYDQDLASNMSLIKESFQGLEARGFAHAKLRTRIQKKKQKKEARGRKVRLGLFAKMLSKVKQSLPKVRNIGIPKLEGISSK
jgi:hypothetical protein